MLVYHRTNHGTEILRDGFRDRIYPDWVDVASTERAARDVLEVSIPDELMDSHVLVRPPLRGYQGVLVSNIQDHWAIIPAADLNENRSTIRLLNDAQLDELAIKRRQWWAFVWGRKLPPEPKGGRGDGPPGVREP